MSENMKCGFCPECRDFAYQGCRKLISEVAMEREKHFDLIYAVAKVFVFMMKNAIV